MSALRGTAWRWLSARPALSIVVALMLPLAALRVVLLLGRRVPMGHDSLQYLQLEYTFWNEAAITGMPPQWLPFMTHGTLSNVWVVISQGMLVGALTPFARVLDGVNFLYIYHAGLLFDEFALLLGCVLLGRRYFRSWAAVIFAAAAVTYTATSSTQPWYEFHIFYLLPLLLYCGDRALREASARYLFLFGLLGIATMLGSLPYFAPITAFTILVFAAAAAAVAPREVVPTLRALLRRLSWRHALALAIPVALLGILQAYLAYSQDSLINFNEGRDTAGHVISLSDFFSYGGYIGFRKYLELFGRYSNNIDNTIYSGMLALPFAVFALLRVRSKVSYVFALSALVMGLFTGASLVSAAFFYFMPLGDFYRHIGLVAPIAMLLLTFYAGFGFEAFWRETRGSRERLLRDRAYVWTPILVLGAGMLLVLGERLGLWSAFDFRPWAGLVTASQPVVERDDINAALTKVLVLIVAYLALFLAMLRWPRQAAALSAVLLAMHVGDVLSRKYELEYDRVPSVSAEVTELFRPAGYAFAWQRTQDYRSNPRYVALEPFLFNPGEAPVYGFDPTPATARYGALYWNMESFLFFDALASAYRSDHWLRGVDGFYRAMVPLEQTLDARHRGFPVPATDVYSRLVGFEHPKLQLFARMHVLEDDRRVAAMLGNQEFAGDLILGSRQRLTVEGELDQLPAEARRLLVPTAIGELAPDEDDRLPSGGIEVVEFTFDTVRLSVDNRQDGWALLYYADGWHPDWRATVGGEAAPVLRANLGYKAIPVPPGESEVALSFGSARTDLMLGTIMLTSALAVAGILYLGWTLSSRETADPGDAGE